METLEYATEMGTVAQAQPTTEEAVQVLHQCLQIILTVWAKAEGICELDQAYRPEFSPARVEQEKLS